MARAPAPLLAFALALLACGVVAQPSASWWRAHADDPAITFTNASSRYSGERAWQTCHCSASANGRPPADDPLVVRLLSLHREKAAEPAGSWRLPTLDLKLDRAAKKLTERYGREGYWNLDAALRALVNVTRCHYDLETGRNIYPVDRRASPHVFVSLRPCDEVPKFAASPAQRALLVPSPAAAPAAGDARALALHKAVPGVAPARPGGDVVGLPEISPAAEGSPEPSPDAFPMPPMPSGSASPSAAPPPPQLLTEGCVAVEHLAGAALQHRRHLRRRVLCARGFCATPNHALIVDGRWASMRALCERGWRCTQETRWVNNLKIAGATRLRYSDQVVITPYDMRFPRAASWAVQMAEDALALVVAALAAAAVAAAAVLAHARLAPQQPVAVPAVTPAAPTKPRTRRAAAPCPRAVGAAAPLPAHARRAACA